MAERGEEDQEPGEKERSDELHGLRTGEYSFVSKKLSHYV